MEKVVEINALGPSSSPSSPFLCPPLRSRDVNAQQTATGGRKGAKEHGGLAFEPRANFALAPRITHTGERERERERGRLGRSEDGRGFEAAVFRVRAFIVVALEVCFPRYFRAST